MCYDSYIHNYNEVVDKLILDNELFDNYAHKRKWHVSTINYLKSKLSLLMENCEDHSVVTIVNTSEYDDISFVIDVKFKYKNKVNLTSECKWKVICNDGKHTRYRTIVASCQSEAVNKALHSIEYDTGKKHNLVECIRIS